jgi:hypothetical protein
MATVGKAEENGFAERFMRTIKEEGLIYLNIKTMRMPKNKSDISSKLCIITSGSTPHWITSHRLSLSEPPGELELRRPRHLPKDGIKSVQLNESTTC